MIWQISIHALREEGDQHSGAGRPSLNTFLSTPSARRATKTFFQKPLDKIISIHALREEGDLPMRAYAMIWQISIHALREEGDVTWTFIILMSPAISIHALREEGDLAELQNIMMRAISIHALREEGDLGSGAMRGGIRLYFYPRPPRGGRHSAEAAKNRAWQISIHALREEGDLCCRICNQKAVRFLSTPSARRATPKVAGKASRRVYFYPRPPRGGRLFCHQIASLWYSISIHALREEGDDILKSPLNLL